MVLSDHLYSSLFTAMSYYRRCFKKDRFQVFIKDHFWCLDIQTESYLHLRFIYIHIGYNWSCESAEIKFNNSSDQIMRDYYAAGVLFKEQFRLKL